MEILIHISACSHLFQVGNQRIILKQTRYDKNHCVTNRHKDKQQLESVKETEVTFDKYTWFLTNISQLR